MPSSGMAWMPNARLVCWKRRKRFAEVSFRNPSLRHSQPCPSYTSETTTALTRRFVSTTPSTTPCVSPLRRGAGRANTPSVRVTPRGMVLTLKPPSTLPSVAGVRVRSRCVKPSPNFLLPPCPLATPGVMTTTVSRLTWLASPLARTHASAHATAITVAGRNSSASSCRWLTHAPRHPRP